MFTITLNKKIFWVLASILVLSSLFLTLYMYQKNQELIQTRALARAHSLEDYFISMRYVYHQSFLSSGIELNEKTMVLLPAHASTFISDMFAQRSKDGVTIRNVSDQPRNPKNRADHFEKEAIEYFTKNREETSWTRLLQKDGKEVFSYTSPLKIEPYCLACHGKKEDVLPSVARMYDTAYDYEVGDVRGVTSISVPVEPLRQETMQIFYQMAILLWSALFFLLFVLYAVIKKLTLQEAHQKLQLQREVLNKTHDLQVQSKNLEITNKSLAHLFSILRTVADCNQILITSKTVDELIENIAYSMHTNTTFASVKLLLLQEGVLHVKASLGLDEEFDVLPLEQQVATTNSSIFVNTSTDTLPPECLAKVQKHKITEVYVLPLRKDHDAQEALGVLSICSQELKGLSEEEKSMIDELAGDVGFALNSFFQKDEIEKLSFYDMLTALPNQKLFEVTLKQAFDMSTITKKYGAVLFLDFDNFKSVNDLFSMDSGDSVLKTMANRLLANISRASMVARYGSDKFLLLFENLSVLEHEAALQAQKIAQEILLLAQEPFEIGEQKYYLTGSAGIVLFMDHLVELHALINQAEYAMRTAKEDGKNSIRFYNQTLQDMAKSRSMMLQKLQESMGEDAFYLLYQKQVDANANVVGVEALIRWRHPELGEVSPSEFIPLAEESGLIKTLGKFVLSQSLANVKEWESDAVKREWRVSVNVSPVEFKDSLFVSTVASMLNEYRVNPSKLRLELTEGVFINNQEEAKEKINALHALGVSVSIDDFGTGYSNLGYLKHLQVDELKIDQSFVFELAQDNADKTIVATIIMMGKAFGFEVIAEGVEVVEQLALLEELGCQNFQGYYFAKPLPLEAL